MSVNLSSRRVLVALWLVSGIGAGCSSNAPPDLGGPADGGAAGAGAAGSLGQSDAGGWTTDGGLVHREAAVSCPATSVNPAPPTDAGTTSCTKDADCQPDGGGPLSGYCLRNVCSLDRCLSDDDCSAGAVCICASDGGFGNIKHFNSCVASTCRIDADCGAGGLCSPGHGYCGSSNGYHCRSAADTCGTAENCPNKSSAGNCEYAPSTGHWQCMAPTICAG
jgi:hypothetical protein